MAYNKAKEEKKWRIWKDAEEKKMRELGVREDTIEQLRVHDWTIFNSDRRYYQRMQETGTYLQEVAEDTTPLTLQIALMKIQGYSTREIASYLGIT